MNRSSEKLNNFHDDLKFADTLSAVLDQFYLSRLPGAVRVEKVTDLVMQRKGVDKIVHLRDGRQIKIEEKIRRKEWPDILLEIKSRGDKPGWLFNCQADYLAYVYKESMTVRFIPVLSLQMAWMKNGADWERRYGTREAYNSTLGGYKSVNIPVPRERLAKDLLQTMAARLPGAGNKIKKGVVGNG